MPLHPLSDITGESLFDGNLFSDKKFFIPRAVVYPCVWAVEDI